MDNKVLYGVMTIIFNEIGVPHFMQGKVKTGVIRIILSCIPVVGQIISIINLIKGIIMGINILKMSDEDYAAADKATLLTGIPN